MSDYGLRIARHGLRRLCLTALACAACILLNLSGSRLCALLGIKLYLDNVGTLLAALYGGFLPGIVCGYFTNLIIGLSDGVSLYYGVVSVLIAMAAGYFASHHFFKTLRGTCIATLTFAFIGGGLSSIITWFLYGLSYGDGITLKLALTLEAYGFMPELAQFFSNMLVDTIDKAFTVIIALALYRMLPTQLCEHFLDFSFWQQTPLSAQERDALRSSPVRLTSVQTKIAALMGVVLFSVVGVNTYIGFSNFNSQMVEEQAEDAFGITRLLVATIDPNRIDDYLTRGRKAPGFTETEQEMILIRDSFDSVAYVYAYRIDEDGCHVVFDPDTQSEPGDDPGDVVPIDEAFREQLPALLAGDEVEPVISNDSYGRLLTVYQPLKDDEGNCVCYVCADIPMEHIAYVSYSFITRVIALFAAFFILVCVLVLWLAEYSVMLPLNSIAYAMLSFAFDSEDRRFESVRRLAGLNIQTGDEIEELYGAVLKTANDSFAYIKRSQDQMETISRMQDNLIMVMADLVESRDQFTGDHVRKTAAYTKIIMDEMRAEGIYSEALTDEFVSNVVHSAPLHDIGKMVVPDAILNKPGRLTAEEFEMMKRHTVAGYTILEHAEGAVSEPTYLDEAKNLAKYHHEKWAGGGYPTGISGEDIPLSARIMAVADVFDALVSKRSYKDGFPLERAFAIIEEGAGSHFDPQIARAFLNVADKAARIARDHGDAPQTPSGND